MIKANNQNTVKTRQKFDQTFKLEAVNNWLTSGKSASVVALAPQPAVWLEGTLCPGHRRGGEGGSRGQAGLGGRGANPVGGRSPGDPARDRAARHLKNDGHSLRTVAERFERVHAMNTEHAILTLCRLLEVTPSGFYA